MLIDFTDGIMAERQRIRGVIDDKMTQIIAREASLNSNIIGDPDDDIRIDESSCGNPECLYAEKRPKYVTYNLRTRKLWPRSLLEERPLTVIWAAMKDTKWTSTMVMKQNGVKLCQSLSCLGRLGSGRAEDFKLEPKFDECVRETQGMVRELCLECVLSDGKVFAETCEH